jgi:site-specific DNA-methyltransferase (adenine-specific)
MPADSVDAVVTDPPYHLLSTVKRFAATAMDDDTQTSQRGRDGADGYARLSRGFMGKMWDGGDVAFRPETWAVVMRVLKPGGHILAFGAPKNVHRLTCAIEDAGFEIRNCVMWLFGSGFPKSHNVANSIDKKLGQPDRGHRIATASRYHPDGTLEPNGEAFPAYEARTDAGKPWGGWGTALKPAYEPIILARKPLIGTVAENVLAHGTGALNIDGCRVATNGPSPTAARRASARQNDWDATANGMKAAESDAKGRIQRRGNPETFKQERPSEQLGRWPANVLHDGSEEVLAAFPDAPGQQRKVGPEHGDKDSVNTYGDYGPRQAFEPRNDSGSAARFFYCAKAGKKDRNGSKHPTVKPIALMRYLCRLVTPPGGTILDPFAGTGTTGQAALEEGFNAVLIEKEDEYVADIRRRFNTEAPALARFD